MMRRFFVFKLARVGGGEAAARRRRAEEEGELAAPDERGPAQQVSLESSGLADGRGGLSRDELEGSRDGLVTPVAAYFPG